MFEGYASIYGEPDSFGDTIRPGAFAKTLKNRKATPVAMLWSHDPSRPIGVWTAMAEDARGLKVKGRLIRETSGGCSTRSNVSESARIPSTRKRTTSACDTASVGLYGVGLTK